MSEQARASRKTLTSVDKELRTLVTSTIDLLMAKGMVPSDTASRPWAVELESPSGVRFRFESGIVQPIARTAAAPSAPAPTDPKTKPTKAQTSRLGKAITALGLDDDTLATHIDTVVHGKTRPDELTRAETSDLITALEREIVGRA